MLYISHSGDYLVKIPIASSNFKVSKNYASKKMRPISVVQFKDIALHYGITGCEVFKAGIQNWKGFCIKINCSQMKLLNFENWTNGKPK